MNGIWERRINRKRKNLDIEQDTVRTVERQTFRWLEQVKVKG